ncbi:FAD-dependent monooxygenase [Sedimentitalea arenosa]|uniref:FAD-dependent monooxygenase n=1 Tax=Sedimentitalea arenosa TaxID=2798803 RepID=A0A8J7JC58_9RHOB|nr:FAD-dependent monooxygenase [Arenibacterium arenosum]MBJ6373178.1 FAD-dependent monooxygenase [Arenibacterium arenosum]
MQSEIVVVGAGIGGVAVATALAQSGRDVTVLEQAAALEEVGAGLQISANGMAVLRALGVADAVRAGAVRSEGTEIRDAARGRLVTRVPPPAAGPTWYLHRADLLDRLVERARSVGVVFDLGARVDDYAPEDTGCAVTLAGGETRRAGLVIAADGGQSRARQRVEEPSRPVFSRQVAWRALIPWTGAVPSAAAVLTMAPGRHVVSYPLRGGALMNLVAVEERADWTREGWRHEGDPAALRAAFAGFGGAVGDMLNAVDRAHLWALYLHPVATRWHRGGLVLLGDAAHPTLPFMAQGACLALEDAWVLARCLTGGGGRDAYRAARAVRAQRVVAVAAGNARRFHLGGPARWAAQAALRLGGSRIAPRYDWIYGHDVTA